MKHTSKRLQALVLVLAMCVSFLQIPSFAADHSGNAIARSATFESDGSFTITKSCDAHKDASEKVVSGKIVEKKNATGGSTYIAVGKDGKELVDENGNALVDATKTEAQEPTCATNGTIKYYIIVDGKSFYSDPFETAKATGEHKYATVPATGADYNSLISNNDFSLVSDDATCDANGDAVFAQKCTVCGHINEDEKSLVKVNHSVDHTFIKDNAGKTPKVFTEELKAPTCKDKGDAIQYYVCKFCKDKFYIKADGTYTTAKSQAKHVAVPKLNHTFKYTVLCDAFYHQVGDKDLTASDFIVNYECTACNDKNAYDEKAKPVKVELVADKTVTPKFDCTVGSQTYKVTYEFTDFSKKNADNTYATGTASQEVTVDYYPAHTSSHDWGSYVRDEDSVVKATCTKDGSYNMVKICKVCGEKEVIATIPVSATGKHTAAAAKKENVVAATTKKGGSYDLVVRCADCGEILSSTHKTTAKITVKASKVTNVTNVKGKKAKVTVKKASSISGYQIQYGTKKNFKGAKAVNTKATTKTLTKLAKNKKYYVRVRTYKVVDGKTYYSSWSGSKTVTIKK